MRSNFLVFLSACALFGGPWRCEGQAFAQQSEQRSSDAALTGLMAEYGRLLTQGNLTPEAMTRATATFALLRDPETRRQILGSTQTPREIPIALEDRENIAKLAEVISPVQASRIRRLGTGSAEFLGNMGGFYLAVGVSETWKCFQSGDPAGCRAFVDSLRDWTGHVGFGLFVAGSNLTQSLVQWPLARMIGQEAAAQSSLPGMVGLAAGALASDVFSEFVNHPATQDYLKTISSQTFRGRDSNARKQKRAEALKKLCNDTFCSAEWRADKLPDTASLVLASVASTATMKLAGHARSKLPRATKNCTFDAARGLLANDAAFDAVVTSKNSVPARFSAVSQFMDRRAAEVPHLLVFMAWHSVLGPRATAISDYLTIEKALRQSRESAGKEWPSVVSLDRTEKNWDRYRRRMLTPDEQIMGLHSQQLLRLDQEIMKPKLLYQWFIDGMLEDDPAWEAAREGLYKDSTRPAEVQKELDRYLNGFFCGPEPSAAVREARSIKGVPVPGRFSTEILPYRVAPISDSQLCSSTLPMVEKRVLFVQKLRSENFGDALLDAKVALSMAAQPLREKMISEYEERVRQHLMSALEGSLVKGKSETKRGGLPVGVLPAFAGELADLTKIEAQAGTDVARQQIVQRIERVKAKRASAEELVQYMKTPRAEREESLDAFSEMIEAMLSASDENTTPAATHDNQVIKYFKSYQVK